MSKTIKSISKVSYPDTDATYNFYFTATDEDGIFKFQFKYLNERWNCWVTTPDEETREIGVYPNVISNLGFLDYSFIFATDLTQISFSDLFDTELLIIKWA